MADLTLAEFQARYPSFSAASISDATQQLYVDDANAHLYEPGWNTEACYKKGAAAYAAHYLAIEQKVNNSVAENGLEGSSGTEGALTSAQAGPLMATFGASIQDKTLQDDFYTQTDFGKIFLSLKQECTTGHAIASCS